MMEPGKGNCLGSRVNKLMFKQAKLARETDSWLDVTKTQMEKKRNSELNFTFKAEIVVARRWGPAANF